MLHAETTYETHFFCLQHQFYAQELTFRKIAEQVGHYYVEVPVALLREGDWVNGHSIQIGPSS